MLPNFKPARGHNLPLSLRRRHQCQILSFPLEAQADNSSLSMYLAINITASEEAEPVDTEILCPSNPTLFFLRLFITNTAADVETLM